MKVTLYTLNVNNYEPRITELTYPLLKRYAEKLGAEFFLIDKRRWPEFPPVYEKLQIYYLSKKRKDDWSIYIDSDALIHPDMFNIIEHLKKDTVCHHGADINTIRWKFDDYFRRDGRFIGSCNWFSVASSWCRDLWHPLDDLTLEEAMANIFPTHDELITVVSKEHLIDDYVLSRNIAKYGLKFTIIIKLMQDINDTGDYVWHQYTIPVERKLVQLKQTLERWKIAYTGITQESFFQMLGPNVTDDEKMNAWNSYSEGKDWKCYS